VLEFVVRQQLEPWRTLRPWLASCVALPGSLLLLGVSFGLSVDLRALLSHGSMRRTVAAFPFRAMRPMRSRLPRCPPSLTPRAFAAARAALVRAEIIEASCSATAARM
jgi:hypothetical protein